MMEGIDRVGESATQAPRMKEIILMSSIRPKPQVKPENQSCRNIGCKWCQDDIPIRVSAGIRRLIDQFT